MRLCLTNKEEPASDRALLVKVPSTKPDDVSSILGNHMMKEENDLHIVTLCSQIVPTLKSVNKHTNEQRRQWSPSYLQVIQHKQSEDTQVVSVGG